MTAHPIDPEALRRLADAATEGPWTVDNGGGYYFSVTQGPDGDYIACDVIQPDAEFIAAARTAVPALLDLLARWERRSGGHIQVDVDEWCDENDMLHMDLQAAVARAEAAEHRATRAEAQSAIRGRAVAIHRGRAREAEADRDLWREASAKLAASSNQANADLYEAEARIKAVRDVLDRAHDAFENVNDADIRRALEG